MHALQKGAAHSADVLWGSVAVSFCLCLLGFKIKS